MSATPAERVEILRRRLARAEDAATIAAIVEAAGLLAEHTRDESVRAACSELVDRAGAKAAKFGAAPAMPRQAGAWMPPPGSTPQIRMIRNPFIVQADGCLSRTVYADESVPWHR